MRLSIPSGIQFDGGKVHGELKKKYLCKNVFGRLNTVAMEKLKEHLPLINGLFQAVYRC